MDIGVMAPKDQPVDMAAAQEFMQATLQVVDRDGLAEIEAELQEKGRLLQNVVNPTSLPDLSADQLRLVLRSVFATRRRSREILDHVGSAEMKYAIRQLLYGDTPVAARFQQFVDVMSGFVGDVRVLRPKKSSDSRTRVSVEEAALQENVFCDLASELLHFTRPNDYWLWTRWLWNPKTATGAMPLVTMEGIDLHGRTVGETYMKLGAAMAFVKATGDAAGFSDFGSGPFGIDVFLACVYAIYMYTTLRMRMTQEFNRVVPRLPDLIRRLLGVWKLEL